MHQLLAANSHSPALRFVPSSLTLNISTATRAAADMLHLQRRCHVGHGASSSFPAAPRACMQRPTLRCCSARTSVATTAEADPAPSTSAPESQQHSVSGKVAVFAASKQQSQPVQEQQRPLAEYMALPASQYSVLDARKIERVDDTTFRCYVGGLNFLNFSVEPVITVSVTVEDKGCTIKLLSCRWVCGGIE